VVHEDFAYAIPDQIDDASASPLLCAGIIGYRALRRADIRPGCRLGLYGFGASAHIAIQVARHLDCRVFVMTREPRHRRLAEQLGAEWTGAADAPPPEPLDSAVLFAPVGHLVPPALAALDRGGTLAIAGIYVTDTPPLDYEKHLFYEKNLRSVTANTRADGQELLHIAAEIPIRAHTVPFPLRDANRALQQLKHDGFEGAGILVPDR
jgi:propanol-preferring alcohol dehydrogenase